MSGGAVESRTSDVPGSCYNTTENRIEKIAPELKTLLHVSTILRDEIDQLKVDRDKLDAEIKDKESWKRDIDVNIRNAFNSEPSEKLKEIEAENQKKILVRNIHDWDLTTDEQAEFDLVENHLKKVQKARKDLKAAITAKNWKRMVEFMKDPMILKACKCTFELIKENYTIDDDLYFRKVVFDLIGVKT